MTSTIPGGYGWPGTKSSTRHPPGSSMTSVRLPDGQYRPSASEEYYAAEAAVLMAYKYSRPDLVEIYLNMLDNGNDITRKAAKEFRRRRDRVDCQTNWIPTIGWGNSPGPAFSPNTDIRSGHARALEYTYTPIRCTATPLRSWSAYSLKASALSTSDVATAIAEPCTELGYTYVGFDLDPTAQKRCATGDSKPTRGSAGRWRARPQTSAKSSATAASPGSSCSTPSNTSSTAPRSRRHPRAAVPPVAGAARAQRSQRDASRDRRQTVAGSLGRDRRRPARRHARRFFSAARLSAVTRAPDGWKSPRTTTG